MMENDGDSTEKTELRQNSLSTLRLVAFLLLAGLAMACPYFVFTQIHPIPGALAYITIGLLWFKVFPCTCMTGGLLHSTIAMPILGGAILMPIMVAVYYLWHLVSSCLFQTG